MSGTCVGTHHSRPARSGRLAGTSPHDFTLQSMLNKCKYDKEQPAGTYIYLAAVSRGQGLPFTGLPPVAADAKAVAVGLVRSSVSR
jgi:hypothetical protein